MKKVILLVLVILFCASQVQAQKGELHRAVVNNDIDLVKSLINRGEDINSGKWTKRSTPLMLAAQNGNLEIAQILLDAGADPGKRSISGSTALHYACWQGNFEIARLLIKNGANIFTVNKGREMPAGISEWYWGVDISKY